MNDLITIIINVYNGEKYLKKCLDSVINQTYKNIEILVINDGSTDKTLNILKKYKDKRIRIINQKNIGLSLSRNIGIKASRGKYLYFVDVDDFILEDTIEYLYNLLKKYKVKIATSKVLDIYNYNYQIKQEKEKIEVLTKEEMLKKILLSEDRSGATWNKLIDKKLFNKVKFENRIINDVVTTYKLVLEVDKIVYSNQIKYFYFHHKNSILSKKKINHLKDLYDASIERYNYINERYTSLYESDLCLMLMIITLYLHSISEINKYLKEKEAFNLYKKLFSLKKIQYINRFNDRIKLILFRINPKLCLLITSLYLKGKK